MNKKSLAPFRLYIVPLLVVLVIVLLVPLVLLPQLQTIRDKNLEVQKSQKRLDLLKTKLEALSLIDEEDENLKLSEIEEVVPSRKELARLVVGVRSLASKAGLSVAAIEFSPGRVASASATTPSSKRVKAAKAKSKKEDKEKTTFMLSVKTKKVSDLQKFFTSIQKAKRLLGVNTVEINRDEEDVYTYELEIIAPFREIQSKGDIIATPLPLLTQIHDEVFNFVADFINFTNVTIQKVKTGVKDPFK